MLRIREVVFTNKTDEIRPERRLEIYKCRM